MSRSGYSEDCEMWDLIRWRGAVKSGIRGNRGQAFLKEMLAALDAMPQKRLIADELEKDGQVCAMGAVGLKRGIDMSWIDPDDRGQVAETFGISRAMAAEIAYENDDRHETPEHRWSRMRLWVTENLQGETA